MTPAGPHDRILDLGVHRLGVTLPTNAESYREQIGVSVSENDSVIACFCVEFHVPLGAEGQSDAAVDTGLVDAVRGKNICCRHRGLKKAKEGIEARYRGNTWRGELLAPVVQTSSADEV
jgi:hypothetical protein